MFPYVLIEDVIKKKKEKLLSILVNYVMTDIKGKRIW